MIEQIANLTTEGRVFVACFVVVGLVFIYVFGDKK